MVWNTFLKLRKISFLREHRQKTLVMLREDFGCLRGWGRGGRLSDSVKKGKFVTKYFFQIMMNEVLKICEKYLLI